MTGNGAAMQVVVVFCGLTGSGKSYLARAWAAAKKYPYFNTDVIRKRLAGHEPTTACSDPVGQGLYSLAATRRTYDELARQAMAELADPDTYAVVLDGTYLRQEYRDRLRSLLEPEIPVFFVLCRCHEEEIKRHLAQRATDPDAVSDGRWEIYEQQRSVFQYPAEVSADRLICLDTSKPLAVLLARLDHFLVNKIGPAQRG